MPATVTVDTTTGLTQRVVAGEHELRVDEPTSLGGGGEGPTPYDLLLAALGACTSMTLQIYAKRKGWPLFGVVVTLSHDRVHAEDCADCTTGEGYISEIKREIFLQGPLTDEQRQRLLEIASRCPVHRTLTSEIKVRDTLRPATST
jgi:putative redox protein